MSASGLQRLWLLLAVVHHLYHAPASANIVSNESHKDLANDDSHHLEVVCCLSPNLTALSEPAAIAVWRF